jgi:hypothetical protein
MMILSCGLKKVVPLLQALYTYQSSHAGIVDDNELSKSRG